MFNSKLMNLLQTEHKLAWDIISALRGTDKYPDDLQEKLETTAVIRQWALDPAVLRPAVGEDARVMCGAYVAWLGAEELEAAILKLAHREHKMGELWHWHLHLMLAARAIAAVEGWGGWWLRDGYPRYKGDTW